MHQQILQAYQHRIEFSDGQIKYFQKKANVFSLLRLLVFGFLLVAIYWSVKESSLSLFALFLIVIGLLFNWLVARQSEFDKQVSYYQNFKAVNQNEIDSIAGHTNIYDTGEGFTDEKHHYSADLDIFGKDSLFELINRAATGPGRSKLALWLSRPADKTIILNRQAAVKELGGKNDWKLEMQARLLFANKQNDNQLPALFKYLHTPLNMPGEAWLSKYVIISPILFLISFVAAFYIPNVYYVAVSIALINYIIVSSKMKYTQKTDLIAGRIGRTLNNYADVFASIEKQNMVAGYNIKLVDAIKRPDNKSMSAVIKQLAGYINNLDARLIMFLGFILNALLVWDVRFVIAIESWKRRNHENIEAAFDVIAEFEVLMSLTSLHINNPEWCFADIADGEAYTLVTKQLGHPLIKIPLRVANDYELTDTFKIDIITGSNMAGKSTFLRTLGINTVLALCGAPACAEAMQVSIIHLVSYMRIKDSLNESTSTFKAELDRLQMLLKAVDGQHKVFFLIDEMLRGTNSVDKYIGSKAVIEQLIAKKGVGLVATHDLQIAHLEQQYPTYIRNFYFDIQVQNGEMLFDYKIKAGECKTFNASMLLRQIGINVPEGYHVK